MIFIESTMLSGVHKNFRLLTSLSKFGKNVQVGEKAWPYVSRDE